MIFTIFFLTIKRCKIIHLFIEKQLIAIIIVGQCYSTFELDHYIGVTVTCRNDANRIYIILDTHFNNILFIIRL